jgi:hypothetical protein
MQLEITHPSGAEEWACAECGRRILMQWPPNYKRVVLEPGDEFAIHSGSKGGLNVSSPLVEEADAPELSEEMRAALEEALKDVDFDAPSSADDW